MTSYSLSKYQPKQSCPATTNNSNQVSFQQPSRKFSMAELNHRIDIDQVMVDIKLTPLKSNEFNDNIKTIYNCLDWLKKLSPTLLEEVRTAELIIQSIEAKWKKHQIQTKRNSHPNTSSASSQSISDSFAHQTSTKHSHKKPQDPLQSKRKPNPNLLCSHIYNDISPIKQLDQATSRIVYTNFSIKEIENSCKKELSHKKLPQERQSVDSKVSERKTMGMNQSRSTKDIAYRPQSGSKPKTMHKRENSVFTVSIFDAEDQQMEKLTRNIQALDRVLQRKGLSIKNDINVKDPRSANKTALKEVTLNSAKFSSGIKSDKKPLIFNSKQRNSTANKENY